MPTITLLAALKAGDRARAVRRFAFISTCEAVASLSVPAYRVLHLQARILCVPSVIGGAGLVIAVPLDIAVPVDERFS